MKTTDTRITMVLVLPSYINIIRDIAHLGHTETLGLSSSAGIALAAIEGRRCHLCLNRCSESRDKGSWNSPSWKVDLVAQY